MLAVGFWYVMLRESEVFVYYFDVLILLCCRWEFFVAVPLGMNVFLNADSAFKKTFVFISIFAHHWNKYDFSLQRYKKDK